MSCRRCAGCVETVGHAGAIQRLLGDTINRPRRRDAGDIQNRRQYVDNVVILAAHLTPRRNALRPGHDQAVAHTAEVGGDLLHPGKGRGGGEGPANGEAHIGILAAEDVQMLGQPVGIDVQFTLVTGQVGQLVQGALWATFTTAAVVALYEHHQGVIGNTHALQLLHQATKLRILEGQRGGEHLHKSRVNGLFVLTQAVPGRYLPGPRGQPRSCRDDSRRDLPCENPLALNIPALIELAAETGYPVGGCL